MEELVSIIMPSYNTGKYIAETINSVLSQTYINWELLIVDDCSTDNTDEVVAQFDDLRIRYLKNDNNSGAAVTRNYALREANGRWIAFLDSDDLWLPQKLEKQIAFMEINSYHFSYTNYEEIDENSKSTGVTITGPHKISKLGMYCFCWPGCLTVMYDAYKIGLIQIDDIKKNNDYGMWLQVSRKAECFLLPEMLGQYRKRKGSISNHSYLKLIKWHYRLWMADGKGPFSACIMTLCNLVFGVIKKIRFVHR